MQIRNENESYFRQVITVLGIGCLFFLLFLMLISVAVTALATLPEQLPISESVAKIAYQLIYGALYLAAFLCPIPIMKALMRAKRLPWQPTTQSDTVSGYLPLILLGGVTVILALSDINAWLIGFLDLDRIFESTLPTTNGKMSALDMVLSFLVMAVVPAFCEELLFRGAILTNLLPFGRSTAVLISALAFSLMHQNPAQFLYAFGAGILLGVLYEKTGNIRNCILLHLFNNATSLVSTILVQAFGEKTGTRMVLLAGAVLVAAGLFSIVFLTCRISRKPDLESGVFGRSLPQADGYADHPVEPARAVRLVLSTPLGVFFIACAVIGVATAVLLVLGGGML